MTTLHNVQSCLYVLIYLVLVASKPNESLLPPLQYPPSINIGPFFNSEKGTYYFHYDTGNDGPVSFRGERRFETGAVSGYFGYIDPNGVLRITHYTADGDGSGAQVKLLSGNIENPNIDGIIYISADHKGTTAPAPLASAIQNFANIDNGFKKHVTVIPIDSPAKRLIFSPVTKLGDYDDVRSFSEAARAGVKRALSAGVKNPLLILPSNINFTQADLVTLLGTLEALYVPIQVREDVPARSVKSNEIYVTCEDGSDTSKLLEVAAILEEGRIIARDIGGGDPERMTAPRVEAYIKENFEDSKNIQIEVIDDEEVLQKEYPLFSAVNRAASVIERHRGRVMYMRYEPEGCAAESLYLVGKGITYDTGGADIKTNGKMVGMSRDKCGAAAVAGFMKIVSRLAPTDLRVVGALCLARNSCGENAYVADEVLIARSGARVRVGNTDAEGRMVMADVLCKLKEEALNVPNPQLVTIATLTGHAVQSVGPYTIAVDNCVARKENIAAAIQTQGMSLGDPLEVSVLRREDFKKHSGQCEGDDVHQNGGVSSTRSQRGHQGPTAFLVMASGLDKNGLTSEKPLKYTHLDIAGSAGDPPVEPSASPILALYGTFLNKPK